MTDEQPMDTTKAEGEPIPDEPLPDEPAPDEAGTVRAREWLSQLETMIQDIATQAAPVARQVGAKAAELAAVAAVKAGPIAHKAADATTDYGQRFAEKAQAVAAELRSGLSGESSVATEAAPDDETGSTPEPAAEDAPPA
jgi:hypothetical protein